jgi:hypothetical protein
VLLQSLPSRRVRGMSDTFLTGHRMSSSFLLDEATVASGKFTTLVPALH